MIEGVLEIIEMWINHHKIYCILIIILHHSTTTTTCVCLSLQAIPHTNPTGQLIDFNDATAYPTMPLFVSLSFYSLYYHLSFLTTS